MRRQLLALAAALTLTGAARAQMNMPDVQIMVAPGLGNWTVAVVYPRQVPHGGGAYPNPAMLTQ